MFKRLYLQSFMSMKFDVNFGNHKKQFFLIIKSETFQKKLEIIQFYKSFINKLSM